MDDISILATMKQWEPWRKHTLLLAAIFLLGYSGWYIWFLTH